jgi:hypothetical protein
LSKLDGAAGIFESAANVAFCLPQLAALDGQRRVHLAVGRAVNPGARLLEGRPRFRQPSLASQIRCELKIESRLLLPVDRHSVALDAAAGEGDRGAKVAQGAFRLRAVSESHRHQPSLANLVRFAQCTAKIEQPRALISHRSMQGAEIEAGGSLSLGPAVSSRADNQLVRAEKRCAQIADLPRDERTHGHRFQRDSRIVETGDHP